MDTSTVCPVCLQEDALSNGYCRFCKKRIDLNLPVGVLPPGVVLNGRYLTGIFLGKGGFGTIYKALDLFTRRIVAIKEYYPSAWCVREQGVSQMTVKDPESFDYGLKHFKGEAQIMRSIQSIPEVVRLYDDFDENNTSYYVMEFLEGETLLSYLRDHKGKLSFSDSVTLMMPLILGMKKVHDSGTTHRDISPDNMFLCRDGSVRIIDFGAAASRNSPLARSFIPIEKEGYSPPEQHTVSTRGDTQGIWSDIYAMAGTLYRCCVGKRPPSASQRQAGDELDFAHSGLTQQQIRTLEKNLSLDADQRCQSMLSFAQEIVKCINSAEAAKLYQTYPELTTAGHSVPLPPPPPPPQPLPPGPKAPRSRRLVAFVLDMFFFQAVPFALGQLVGGPLPVWMLAGLALGVIVTWLMTNSDANGGPGEVLCGLEVSAGGIKPDRRQALLYCLIRIVWPIKAAEAVYYLATKKLLNEEVSGCSSHLKGEAQTGKQLVLKITDGFYQGSTIPVAPGRYIFGRNPDRCTIVYPLLYNVVSRVHFELVVDAAGNIFITGRSGHGTWLDGRRLDENTEERVPVGSTITFGKEKVIITTN